MRPIALYVHVPFCRRKCAYCAFHSLDRWEPEASRRIADAILADMNTLAELMPRVRTVYVGGGTPTVLDPQTLRAIVERPRDLGASPIEITVEANPESASSGVLHALAEAGVDRLSIGVQTLDEQAARSLGRRLTTTDEIERIRRDWPGSLGADLIHAIPAAARGATTNAVGTLCATGIDHLSVYDLSVEPATPLAEDVAAGRLRPVDPGDEWSSVVSALETAGFRRYEVSNFAREGAECLHNTAYWNAEEYIGLGPSAVSTRYDDHEVPGPGPARSALRIVQPSDHGRYLLRRHPLDGEIERLGPDELLREYVMLGLRTTSGIETTAVHAASSPAGRAGFDNRVATLVEAGLLARDATGVAATSSGLDLYDRVIARLVEVLEAR